MIARKRKFNLSNLPDKVCKIIGIVALTLILLGQIYSHIFPESIDSLKKKSDVSWAELQRKAQELDNLVNETERGKDNTNLEGKTTQPDESNKSIKESNFTFFILGLRILASIMGFLFVYIAVFLYENEQGKIQNKLEDVWVRIDDAQKYSLSKHTVFVNTVAGFLTKTFNLLFGIKLLSLQAIGASICFAVLSANLVFFLRSEQSYSDSYLFSCIFWLVLGIIPTLIHDSYYTKLWFIILVFIIWDDFVSGYIYYAYYANMFNIPVLIIVALGIIVGVLIGCLLFLLSIVIVRKTLQKISTSKSFWRTAIFPLLNCIPILILFVFSYLSLHLMSNNEGNAGVFWLILLFSVLYINISFLLPALLFLVVSFFLILHKLVWGIIDRPIYTFQKLDIAKRTKLLATLGGLLITAGIGGWEWIDKIIDKINPY